MVKKTSKKITKKLKICKGGSGILTYGVNDYKVDTQLDNMATTRQMFNDQSVMNSRVLGGSRRKSKRKSGKRGCKKGGKRNKAKKTRRCN